MWNFKIVGLLTILATKALAVTVTVSATASHAVPTTLFGQMFESGDGGLYAELLQNRAFQQVTPGTSAALSAWAAVNGATISVIQETVPVSSALPNALHVTIPSGKTGQVGFSNSGYSGIKVAAGSTYSASFYYRFPTSSSFSGNAVINLQSTSGQVFGSATVQLSGSQTTWKQVSASITPSTSASSTSNLFTVTLDGASASGQTINFAMFSLFPPTFKGRANGMRVDIAEALAEMGPSFFRLPGGNNLEGQTTATRWQWNATVGALVNRPGRQGDWGYTNTDGLGLFEYLTWCEDVGMQPIMAIWSGYSLGGTSIATGQLGPYIQQAMDQINFVIGDPSQSSAAALRSSLGHPAPFTLNYVEVGNEDFFSSTYTYRWNQIVTALQAEFPNIHFIATGYVNNPALTPNPGQWDVHVYQTPTWFSQNAFYYDSYKRDGTKYFEGEYAAISTNSNNLYGAPGTGRLTYPTVQSAVGEAAFMTGLERNSDIVFAASYAPLLGSVSSNQWVIFLAFFICNFILTKLISSANAVYRSTSFYVQKLFSLNRGDAYLPSTLPTNGGTLFWSVVQQTSTNSIIIKISNTATSSQSLTFVLPFNTVASSGTAQVLTGDPTSSNTPSNPNLIVPVTSTISTGKTFTYSAPANSVNVLTVSLDRMDVRQSSRINALEQVWY
ncbi:alfa-L-arabinofuranosidase precursor [Gymnopilus junonius]|uniref:non-reducing end alpha-L-arabinofuranosidase n=1 Tax=Gymnopilus junonius TaxID=109634 RepID=A0A9P5TK54_GYMJU|nr:alfa-L-arabinofuranosidase precursor [Gymnopilus junonius]